MTGHVGKASNSASYTVDALLSQALLFCTIYDYVAGLTLQSAGAVPDQDLCKPSL